MQWRSKTCRPCGMESAYLLRRRYSSVVDLGKDATKATKAVTELYSNRSARTEYSGGRRLRIYFNQRAPVHAHW